MVSSLLLATMVLTVQCRWSAPTHTVTLKDLGEIWGLAGQAGGDDFSPIASPRGGAHAGFCFEKTRFRKPESDVSQSFFRGPEGQKCVFYRKSVLRKSVSGFEK
jgi:hypothetical protein